MSALMRPFRWFYHEFGVDAFHETGRDAYIIVMTRTCRMFAYGTNSLILAIFFSALGFSDHQIGAFMTLTLLGDVLLGTLLTLIADRIGRRRVLLFGSFLMATSGLTFAIFENFWILLLAAIVGVISVTGGDFGPFRSVEESVLSQLTTPSTRADVLAWYVTTSALGSTLGSEVSGRLIHFFQSRDGWTEIDAYHALFWIYTLMGTVNGVLTLLLSDACELEPKEQAYSQISQDGHDELEPADQNDIQDLEATATPDGPRRRKIKAWFARELAQISAPTRSVMYKLWFLLAVDSLADGMVPYSLTNYYMDLKFHPAKSTLGDVTSISYFFSAIGSVFAGPLSRKIGLINTMVFTHVPSSAAVLLFPFPPVLWMSALLLLVRAGLNNMDQAPRSAFIAAVVKPEERTAVMGITGMLRTLAAMAGPTVTGFLAARGQFWIAFVAAGTFRLAYDFGLYAMFVNTKLHLNETKSSVPSDPHTDYERNTDTVELHSLADSGSSDDEHENRAGKVGSNGTDVEDTTLTIPHTTTERVRSRSPHRHTNSNT